MKPGEIKIVTLDGTPTPKLCCPDCGGAGYLDDDQYHGRISTECFNKNCSYHQTIDWSQRIGQ